MNIGIFIDTESLNLLRDTHLGIYHTALPEVMLHQRHAEFYTSLVESRQRYNTHKLPHSSSTSSTRGAECACGSRLPISEPPFAFDVVVLEDLSFAFSPPASPFLDFFVFFFFSCTSIVRYQHPSPSDSRLKAQGKKRAHLLPTPHGSETIEEAHVLEQIRVQP